MADIKEKVKLLVTLQEKDCAIDTLRRQAALIPVQVNEQKELLATLKKEAEDSRKGLVQLQLRRKEKEIELESKEGEIKKHGLELNSIKSNDAYKALLNQIEQCKQGKSSLESEILEIMDSAEKESAKAKDTEKQLKVKEGEMQTGISRLEVEEKKLQDEIAHLEAERNEFARQIPENLFTTYDRIRESREGVGIVHIEGETCSGCHIALRPQLINDVCKGQELVVCDSCSRILYKK